MGSQLSKVALRKKLVVEGLTKREAAEKFQALISYKYGVKPSKDKGDYTVFHWKVGIEGDVKADMILFNNGTLTVSATPNLGTAKFDVFCQEIEKLATSGATSMAEEKPLPITRASGLIEYAKGLSLAAEKERMVAVIICDTSNEIVLTTKMRLLKFDGEALKAGVPKKIEYIEGKGEAVYLKERIKEIRELRNDVAHSGSIPSQKEAEQVVGWSNDFVTHA
jgi:hypothetical protein